MDFEEEEVIPDNKIFKDKGVAFYKVTGKQVSPEKLNEEAVIRMLKQGQAELFWGRSSKKFCLQIDGAGSGMPAISIDEELALKIVENEKVSMDDSGSVYEIYKYFS